MTKIRIYELAKELNISSRELMNKIEDLDMDVSSHMSSIEKEEAQLIKELLKGADGDDNMSEKDIELEKIELEKMKDESPEIEIEDTIIVRDLAEKLNISPSDLITKLIGLGVMAGQNQSI